MLGPVLDSRMGVRRRHGVLPGEVYNLVVVEDSGQKETKACSVRFPTRRATGGQEKGRPKVNSDSPTRQDLLMRNGGESVWGTWGAVYCLVDSR